VGLLVTLRVEGAGLWIEVLVLGWRVTGIGVEDGKEEGTIISAVIFFKPCGVGRLSQPLSTVISHTRKRGCFCWDEIGPEKSFWRKEGRSQ